jgi:hypothetical protein
LTDCGGEGQNGQRALETLVYEGDILESGENSFVSFFPFLHHTNKICKILQFLFAPLELGNQKHISRRNKSIGGEYAALAIATLSTCLTEHMIIQYKPTKCTFPTLIY